LRSIWVDEIEISKLFLAENESAVTSVTCS